jgi:hypothetical protein
VSHGSALVRSPRGGEHPTNIDIVFWGVEYLAVPRHLKGISVEAGNPTECALASEMLGKDVPSERVWALVSNGFRHLAVVAQIQVRETDMDIFDGPFDHAHDRE